MYLLHDDDCETCAHQRALVRERRRDEIARYTWIIAIVLALCALSGVIDWAARLV